MKTKFLLFLFMLSAHLVHAADTLEQAQYLADTALCRIQRFPFSINDRKQFLSEAVTMLEKIVANSSSPDLKQAQTVLAEMTYYKSKADAEPFYSFWNAGTTCPNRLNYREAALADELTVQYGAQNIAVVDLEGQQVVSGYSDVNSDINTAMYDDNLCRHFGFGESVGHSSEWRAGRDESRTQVLTIDSNSGKPVAIPFHAQAGRQLGFYTQIICLRRAPGS